MRSGDVVFFSFWPVSMKKLVPPICGKLLPASHSYYILILKKNYIKLVEHKRFALSKYQLYMFLSN